MIGRRPTPFGKRFEAKVLKTDSCWLWKGGIGAGGYGYTWFNNRSTRAHRASYEFHVAKIPEGMFVLHKCDNPPCVNPEHLFVGTPLDNMLDKIKKGRNNPAKGERNSKSKLTNKEAEFVRKLYRKGGVTQNELAIRYGVHQVCISLIIRNKTYASH